MDLEDCNLRGDSEDNRVGDLTGGSGDEDAHGRVVGGGSGAGHGPGGNLGNLVDAGELVDGS